MNSNTSTLLTGDFHKALLDSIFDAVYMVDMHSNILYWNDSCARITGYTAQEILGHSLTEMPFVHPEQQNQQPVNRHGGIDIVLQTGMPGSCKRHIRRKNDQLIPIESHISPIRDQNGQITGAVEIFRDISALTALEDAHRQLLQISRKDQLTGLYNRTAVAEVLKAEIERARRYNQHLSVIMMDIDHFKRINDKYGHDTGDKVLAKIGSILNHNLRKPDVVGRWGGEEFLVVVPNNDAQATALLAERIRKFIKGISTTEVPETISASFGLAQLTSSQSHDQLLYTADMALYQAKNSGRDRVIIANDNFPSYINN